jgi:uncharacterized protein (TIGR03382 family)
VPSSPAESSTDGGCNAGRSSVGTTAGLVLLALAAYVRRRR